MRTKRFDVFDTSGGYHSTIEMPESAISEDGTPPSTIIVDDVIAKWNGRGAYVRGATWTTQSQ